jgi:hypothetical protein
LRSVVIPRSYGVDARVVHDEACRRARQRLALGELLELVGCPTALAERTAEGEMTDEGDAAWRSGWASACALTRDAR